MSQELWPDSEGTIMESGTELNKLKWTEVLVPKLKGFLSFYTQTWLGIVFNLSYSSKTKPKNKQTTPATFWFPLTDCPCAQNSWPFSQMPLLDTPYSSVYSLPPSYPHPLPIRFSLKFHMLRCFFFFPSHTALSIHMPHKETFVEKQVMWHSLPETVKSHSWVLLYVTKKGITAQTLKL